MGGISAEIHQDLVYLRGIAQDHGIAFSSKNDLDGGR
jgi:hypothetical protein